MSMPSLTLINADAPTPAEAMLGMPDTLDLDVPIVDNVEPTETTTRNCSVCGRPFNVKTGRGRKPTKCEEHRQRRADSTPRGTGAKTQDVEQAVATMQSFNTVLSMLAVGLQCEGTAEMLASDEQFLANCRRSFTTNPKLAARVAKLGQVSGTASLVTAFASFYAPIVMTAAVELPMTPIGSRLPFFNKDT